MQSVVVECSPVWTVVADSVGGARVLGKAKKRRSGRCGIIELRMAIAKSNEPYIARRD